MTATRLEFSLDPGTIGARFHAQLARDLCRTQHNPHSIVGCQACHVAVAPLVKPFARLLNESARRAVRLTYARFVRTAVGEDERTGNQGSTPVWDALAAQAIGSIVE